MDLGNLTLAGLALGQFVSGKEISWMVVSSVFLSQLYFTL